MSLLLHDGRFLSGCVLSEAQLKEMMENEAGSVATTPVNGWVLMVFACSWSAEDDTRVS